MAPLGPIWTKFLKASPKFGSQIASFGSHRVYMIIILIPFKKQNYLIIKLYKQVKNMSILFHRHDKTQREKRAISRQNFNEYIGSPHLAPTQFCYLPRSHREI